MLDRVFHAKSHHGFLLTILILTMGQPFTKNSLELLFWTLRFRKKSCNYKGSLGKQAPWLFQQVQLWSCWKCWQHPETSLLDLTWQTQESECLSHLECTDTIPEILSVPFIPPCLFLMAIGWDKTLYAHVSKHSSVAFYLVFLQNWETEYRTGMQISGFFYP